MSRRWSGAEDKMISDMLSAGASWAAIGRALGCHRYSIQLRAEFLGLKKPPRPTKPPAPKRDPDVWEAQPEPVIVLRERACLCCREPFMSSGAGNRLCSECRRLSGEPMLALATDGRRVCRRYG